MEKQAGRKRGPKVIDKFKTWWAGLGIRNRLLLMFSALVIISVSLCAAVLSIYWSRERITSFDTYADEITKQVSKSVDACLQNIDRLAISIAYSDNMQQVLSVDYGEHFEMYAPNEKLAGWYLANAQKSYNGIQSIYVYDLQGHLFSTPMNFANFDYKLEQEEWLPEFAKSDARTCIIGPYVNKQETYPKEEIISIVRKVKNMMTMKDAGYIFINVKIEDILNDNLQKIWEADGGTLLIVTDTNQIVFDSGDLFRGKNGMDEGWFSKLQKAGSHFDYQYQSRKSRVVFSYSENSGWYVLRIADHQELYSSVHKMLTISAVIAALIILVIFLPMMAFANGFVWPIIRLQKSMLRLTNDNFDPFTEPEDDNEIILQPNGGDEIALLTESFNHMALRLYSMIQTIYQTENEKHKLEIAALSAQINPHFTYNTLGTIKQMALLQNAGGIADLTDAITNLLRATAKYGDGSSTLQKELDLIRDYIFIMQMRYYDNFKCSVTTEDGTLNQPMPCMLIQPIVENAIFHGIYGIDRPGVIDIHVHITDGKLCITVADNGKGIHPEQMKMFLEGPGHTENKYENVGVYNVHRRLQLHYGTEYGLRFKENHPYGTTVTILIPLKAENIYV